MKKPAWLLAGKGRRAAEGEKRNCTLLRRRLPVSAERMAGARFPRDPRQNAESHALVERAVT